MAFSIEGTPIEVPEPGGDAQAIFKELGAKFRLHDFVVKHLVDQIGLTSLQEFARIFTNEDQVGEMVGKVPELEGKELQSARLRMAWCGVREALSSAANRKSVDPGQRTWMSSLRQGT